MTIKNRSRAAHCLFTLGAIAAITIGGAAPAGASCGAAPSTWPSSPRVVLHLSEMRGPTGWDAFTTQLLLLSQASNAVNQFNAIGATSARVTGVETTFDPFVYQGSYNDPAPTIHVGFQSESKITADNKGNSAGGLTSPLYLASNCSPTVTIEFEDLHDTSWSFSSPFALAADGAHYYDAGLKAPSSDGGGEWFRTSFGHELLHAFGLHHTSTEYAMMNHRGDAGTGGFPWANRSDPDAVRPLPYDVKLIRQAYPSSGFRWDLAVLNTWYQVTTGSVGGAADQVKLCTPSLGDRFTKKQTTSDACGAGGDDAGSTRVDEDKMLFTRFALANYSTGSVQVTSKLWLSTDEELSYGDQPALTWDVRDIPAETSELAEVEFKLPWMPAGIYHAIVVTGSQHFNADGLVDPHSPTTDWIPLRGTIQYCDGPCPLAVTPAASAAPTPGTNIGALGR